MRATVPGVLQVNELLRQRQNHESFVQQGGLHCMAK
jgi:hypothetical protein